MRAASYYYLAQAGRPRGHRPDKPDALPRAADAGRQAGARARRRSNAGRELPAIARRVLAALSGAS